MKFRVARGLFTSVALAVLVVSLPGGIAAAHAVPAGSAPVVDSVTISPSHAETNDTVSAVVTAHDADGRSLTKTYQWIKNGKSISGATGRTLDLSQPGNGNKGDRIQVKVTVSDGTSEDSKTSAKLTIADSSPNANGDSLYRARGRQKLTVNAPGVLANDTDPDNDRLTARRLSGPALGKLSLSANGSFTYKPHGGVCNASDSFAYTASDGAKSDVASVSIRIKTARKAATLTLSQSATRVVYGNAVRLTAHLSGRSASAKIFIYEKTGAGPKLLKSGSPNQTGNLGLRTKPRRRSAYFASSKDNCYTSETTPTKVVTVAPLVRGHMVGFFARKGRYALYHANRRHPKYHATVAPKSHFAGRRVTFQWQRLVGRTWKPYLSQRIKLADPSSSIDVTMKRGAFRGVHYRVRIVTHADLSYVVGASRWAYFRVV